MSSLPPTNFERALAQTLGFEGGASAATGDNAGKGLPPGTVHTYRGITQRLYDAWRRKHGQPVRHVTMIEDWEITRIAREEFWDPCRCSELPGPLAIAVFDMAFHSSPRDARIALQKALRVKGDGVIGLVTMAAARAAGPDVVLAFLKARADEVQQILINDPSQVVNLEGWISRMLDQAWRHGRSTVAPAAQPTNQDERK